jgi:hypothetical protein
MRKFLFFVFVNIGAWVVSSLLGIGCIVGFAFMLAGLPRELYLSSLAQGTSVVLIAGLVHSLIFYLLLASGLIERIVSPYYPWRWLFPAPPWYCLAIIFWIIAAVYFGSELPTDFGLEMPAAIFAFLFALPTGAGYGLAVKAVQAYSRFGFLPYPHKLFFVVGLIGSSGILVLRTFI